MNQYSMQNITGSTLLDLEIPMTKEQYQNLLEGLKACELNYKSQIQRLGGINSAELKLWSKNLRQLAPWQIKEGFALHIKNSQWFPTAADIINASVNFPQPKASERPSEALALPEPVRKPVPMPPDFRRQMRTLFRLSTNSRS